MGFARGVKAAEEASKSEGSGSGRRAQYWNIKKDESEILRFLTDADDWYVVRQHVFFPTKPQPKDAKKWPKGMTAVCRKDPAFADEYSNCPLCDAVKDHGLTAYDKPLKTKSMVFALAVRREKIECDGSEAMGGPEHKGKKIIVDRTVELPVLDEEGKETAEKRVVPDIRIVSNTMYSLFGALKANNEVYDSLVGRDFNIKRETAQNGTGTVHVAIALDPIPTLQPGTERWKAYEEALDFYGIDLEETLTYLASDEFYKRFFLGEDGRVVLGGDAASSSATNTMTVDVDEDEYKAKLEAVKSRLSGGMDFA